MAEPILVTLVYETLQQFVRKRPDVGAGKAILNWLLEPASPFDDKGVRPPKRWFVLFTLLAVLMFACFFYFNRNT